MATPADRSSKTVSRIPDFEPDLTTVEGITQWARFYLNVAGNISGMCMKDHLDDDGVVRDIHDILGALGAVKDALDLIDQRNNPLGR